MIDLLLLAPQPMSWVTTVAGSPAVPRFVLELHSPHDDLRIEFGNLRSVATLRRAVMAFHRDAQHLVANPDLPQSLQTRVFHYALAPEPLETWHVGPVDAS